MNKDKFLGKVNKTETCWIWTGCVLKSGYGQSYINGKQAYAHRISYEMFVGPIPPGLVVDHLCFNRPCVNPNHLRTLTLSENSKNRNPAFYTKPSLHGSIYGYKDRGCRCADCKRVWGEYFYPYFKKYRARKREERLAKIKQ